MSALKRGELNIFHFPSIARQALAGGTPPSEPPPPDEPNIAAHPGAIISKRLLGNKTPEWLAFHIGRPDHEVKALLDGRLKITADLATELSDPLKLSPMFFMNLQNRYDELKAQTSAPTPNP